MLLWWLNCLWHLLASAPDYAAACHTTLQWFCLHGGYQLLGVVWRSLHFSCSDVQPYILCSAETCARCNQSLFTVLHNCYLILFVWIRGGIKRVFSLPKYSFNGWRGMSPMVGPRRSIHLYWNFALITVRIQQKSRCPICKISDDSLMIFYNNAKVTVD